MSQGGIGLQTLASIDIRGLTKRLSARPTEAASDVTNPLTCRDRRSAVFGPQRWATPEMIECLDTALT
ncbi:glycerate kinase, partial [Salmonella enterica subsp. enterica serovar Typhimurium]